MLQDTPDHSALVATPITYRDLYTRHLQQVSAGALTPPMGAAAGNRNAISLAFGQPDAASFPAAALAEATAQVLTTDAANALQYGNAAGYDGLRELLLGKLEREGIRAKLDNIIIGNGSGNILGLLAQVFIDEGDAVIIEGPSFLGAVRQFALAGANLLTVPLDEYGLEVEVLEDMLAKLQQQEKRAKFIYTIPNFHNPAGVTMPLERRQALLALAGKYRTPIIEDDAYGELRFEGQAQPSLAALDPDGLVIRLGTFSKILSAGLRLGWAYAPTDVAARLLEVKSDGGTSPFTSRVVAQYWRTGHLEPHIQELIGIYRAKRDTMIQALQNHFPAGSRWIVPEGGFFIWAQLPSGLSATALLARAEEVGVTYLPGTRCFANGDGDSHMRLAFSFRSPEEITTGIVRLGNVLKHA